MNKKDILKSVYDDFFGIDKIAKDNELLSEEIKKLNSDYPKIEIKHNTEPKIITKEDKDNKMKIFFETIDNLYIDDNSKNFLKKLIEYMRKYNEQIEKQYISFNMCIYSNNKETISSIVNLLEESSLFFNYIKTGTINEFSLYNLENPEDIDVLYTKNNLIVYKDFEGLVSKDNIFKEKFIYKIDENVSKNENTILNILISKNEETIKNIFENKPEILDKHFDFKITGINPDVQDVCIEITNKIETSMKIDENFKIKLLDYIAATYPNSTVSFPEYRDKLCEKILFNKEIPDYEKDKTMDEIFAELNELVGLTKVKKMLKDLVNLIDLKNKTKDDLKINNINLHMVFLGNPGTGKTTVARIVAEMLYNLKFVKQNKLIEVSSKDLVAEYVGQTAPKTMSVIQKALGGVLFIDEAYSLASGEGQGNSYNEEAIATLIQAMENYRDEFVVIFAGYTKEMQNFLNANSGIVSRVGYTVEFEDYTVNELIQIFNGMMKKAGFIVTKEVETKLEEIINQYKNTKNFGNARFVRNVYEKTIIKHASNTKNKKDKKSLKTITKEDISDENLLKM